MNIDKVKELEARDLAHIWHPCSQMKDYETLRPIVVERGEGPYLYAADGQKYIFQKIFLSLQLTTQVIMTT